MIDFKPKDFKEYKKERMQYVENCNTPKNYNNKSNAEIIAFFNALITLNHELDESFESEFYGGITNNVESNLSRHCIDAYLGCIRVDSYKRASIIEGMLNKELSADISKRKRSSARRGGKDDLTIVYLAKRNQSGFTD